MTSPADAPCAPLFLCWRICLPEGDPHEQALSAGKHWRWCDEPFSTGDIPAATIVAFVQYARAQEPVRTKMIEKEVVDLKWALWWIVAPFIGYVELVR